MHVLAKRTKPAIGPPPVGQTVSSPNPILHGQPREKFDLGRGPGLPHRKLHGGADDAEKLGQVGGFGSVYPALCVFPHDVVFGVRLKMEIMDGGPKLNKLSKIFESEVGSDLDLANPSIILEGFPKFPSLPRGSVIDKWCDVSWLLVPHPRGVPEGCAHTVANSYGR